jgi:hypothetical protein
MYKKPQIGSGDANFIDYDTKSKVVDWLYSKLDLSKHRYVILNNVMKLKSLQEDIHYVSPNFKGYNYLLLMLTLESKHYCVAIDRKKLSYHKSQLDMKTIQIMRIHMNTTDAIFRGTIFDGKLIQTNNKYIFLIQDCFYLMGNKILDMEMKQKMTHIDSIMKTHFISNVKPYCSNFEFKLNRLHTYDELEGMIKTMPTISIDTNGIIFYPPKSGITILHIEKKVEKVEISSNSEMIEQKSYNIIVDFVNFIKSRNYSYESGSNMKQLWLTRTMIPDVYDISEKEDGDKMGIAMIPNLKTSHMCELLIQDNPVRFNCVYNNKFKKWIPLNKLD